MGVSFGRLMVYLCKRVHHTHRVDVVSIRKEPVAIVTVIVVVDLMLLATLFGGPGLDAHPALVREVVPAPHVLDSGGF